MTTQRKTVTTSGEIKPRITLTTKDYESLSLLARTATAGMPDVASALTEGLARARKGDFDAYDQKTPPEVKAYGSRPSGSSGPSA
jgi:hypothetical protein